MSKKGEDFATSLGAICVREGEAWHLDLRQMALIHGLSVLSRGLAEMLIERYRADPGELVFERQLRPRENPELIEVHGVGRIRLHVGASLGKRLSKDRDALEWRIRTMLGTLQRPGYRNLLFAEASRALVFDFALTGEGLPCRALIEWLPGEAEQLGMLRLIFEERGRRSLDLRTLPHERVEDLERRHFLAGSTRIAQTWRDGLRREVERGHRSFIERRAVHRHLFVQFQKAGLGHIERVELHWGDAEVSTVLESETHALDRDLKRILLALEDDGVRRLLLAGQPFRVSGDLLEAWLDLAQRARVLHVSLGKQRQRGRVGEFLARMPSLSALVEERRQVQPLADVEIVLVHHITAEVLGVIGALRQLGCKRLSTLFVAYAGDAPGSYLGPLLDLPEEEFLGLALSRIPDAARVEGRYRLSREYSPVAGLEDLDARVWEAPDFISAMEEVARHLCIEAAARSQREGRRLLILEDGGYLVPALHRALALGQSAHDFAPSAKLDPDLSLGELFGQRLLGSVEHTRNGHDRILAVKDDGQLQFPSLSIAISKIKRQGEAAEVAVSILQAVESILHACGRILSRRRALVLGSRGAIGSRLVREMCFRAETGQEQVSGLDLACDSGSCIVEAKSLSELPRERWLSCDLLLGVIGKSVVKGADIEDWLLHGSAPELWVASGSTKTVEFQDVAAWLSEMRQSTKAELGGHELSISSEEILDPISGRLFGHRHRLEFGGRRRDLCFLAQLMPINFLYYGVPTEMIEIVLRSLVQAGLGLLANPDMGPGLFAVDHDVDQDGRPLI
ncbi:MAG: hypothetical protein CSA62_04835 [Planctomycetota bacterium]|nr:MAG: hypothetical protein CSA62_04835 [Planctomycetota bacterium]